jgi:CheY-like chemotaxis protein
VAPPADVLVVDDDQAARDMLGRVLAGDGYRVRQAVDGDEAMHEIARRTPDLLVLDLLMPGMDGFQVLEALRTDPATADVPVVVLTGLDLTAEQSAWLRERTGSILQKSTVRPDALLAEIARFLAEGSVGTKSRVTPMATAAREA